MTVPVPPRLESLVIFRISGSENQYSISRDNARAVYSTSGITRS
jgi:hypothetical protein